MIFALVALVFPKTSSNQTLVDNHKARSGVVMGAQSPGLPDAYSGLFFNPDLLGPYVPPHPSLITNLGLPPAVKNPVIVAVLDTGLDLNNEAFKPYLWVNSVEATGKPGIDDDKNGFVDDINGYNAVDRGAPPQDDSKISHGTLVTSVLFNDYLDLPSTAKWPFKILPVKILGKTTLGEPSDMESGLRYVIQFHKQHKLPLIINASWIWMGNNPPPQLRELIKEAGDEGILFVTSIGNNEKGIESPAYPAPASYELSNIVSVGSINEKTGELSLFSKPNADIVAPGENLKSICLTGEQVVKSGTSLSTPIVTQTAASVLQSHPKMKPVDLKLAILNSADRKENLCSKVKDGRVLNSQKALVYKP
jgi:subtilisin family serine protease